MSEAKTKDSKLEIKILFCVTFGLEILIATRGVVVQVTDDEVHEI